MQFTLLKKSTVAAAAIAAAMMVGGAAHAATLTFTSVGPPPPGNNDCSGDFGTSPNCEYISMDDYYFDGDGAVDRDGDPADVADASYTSFGYGTLRQIQKIDDPLTDPEGEPDSIVGEFSFAVVNERLQWTYTPNGSNATVFAFSVKGSNSYHLWEMNDVPLFSGSEQVASGWFSPQGDTTSDISHVTFYGKDLAPIPLPAAGWLLLAGIGGLAAFRRRKSV